MVLIAATVSRALECFVDLVLGDLAGASALGYSAS
jgi:hypothetical protein